MALSTKGTGWMTCNMGMGKNTGPMAPSMKASTSKEWKMEKVILLFLMAVNSLENLSIIKLKGT